MELLERREMMAADLGGFNSHQIQAAAFVGPSSAIGATAVAIAADNSTSTAQNLGIVQGVRTVNDRVGATDPTDFYRFVLDEQAEVSLRLDQLSADIDLYLYDSNGQEITRSWLGGNAAENIVRTLAAGTYFARVARFGSARSTYRLNVDVDIANETMPTARNLGAVNGQRTFTDWVGASDANDYFRFTLNQQSRATIRLDQLAADLDLYLYNSAGRAIRGSFQGGTTADQIQENLAAGTYYVRVTPYGLAASNYRLALDVTGGPFPDVPNFGGANDWNLNAINAPEVWARGYTGSGVIVAVIDTGVDYTHSELVNNMWVNSREIAGNGRDDDGNGYVDDYRGWDFANNDNNPLDQNSHGTHVAGTIAAARNGVGSTGVAYGARIMPVQVLAATGRGGSDAVAAGIRYAVDNGADIINLSLGSRYPSIIASALSYANQMGVFVVASAGNDSESTPGYPARHSAEMSNVLSVGAHTSTNTHSSFSNYVGASGAVQIDAPGSSVYSTIPGNGYAFYNGTSMAAPHVTGVAALVLSANRNLTPSQLRQVLVAGSNRPILGSDSRGGINAAVAVPLALSSGSFATGLAGGRVAPANLATLPARVPMVALSHAAVDAAITTVFNQPASRVTTPSASPRVVVATPTSHSSNIARLAVIESWRPESPTDDFGHDASAPIRLAAFESAWSDMAAELPEAAPA
jgi:subtilisin family serine protease